MRRYGESKVFGQTYRARPGVYALLPRNERVLLTYQGGIHHEFQFPGGGIDPGKAQSQRFIARFLKKPAGASPPQPSSGLFDVSYICLSMTCGQKKFVGFTGLFRSDSFLSRPNQIILRTGFQPKRPQSCLGIQVSEIY